MRFLKFMMQRFSFLALRVLVALALVWSAVGGTAKEAELDFTPQPRVPYLSPEEFRKTVQLPPGYRLELVLAEPDIKEPVVAAFDGNGRMFVAEMRTYMQDIDGSNQLAATSRVSLHWSSKSDGNYDRHSVFVDKLVLPRMILPLGSGELLVNETDTQDIYLYRDTNGDGVSDEKTLWFAGGPRGGNLEHQQSGLIWAMDNWMYTTYNAWRLRWNGAGRAPLKESTAPNGGQWGLTQDDYGKPWYINAGGERGPLNFQTHILYGAFNTKDQFEPDYMSVWPLIGLGDVQGGPQRFRTNDHTLNHFTATCGAEVFRGDRLPADLRGDLLFSEPVGRLIRRTKIEVQDGLTYLRNATPRSEFIRSTDPNFRVVNMNTAPDGTLYLIDMYRGIIQEGNWVREGSFLRKVVQKHQLDKNFGRGRIWRLVYDGMTPGPRPRLHNESPAQLVTRLEHPNGWWRDTAQKLLILGGDKTVAPLLQRLARSSTNEVARLHALWTLEGLGVLDTDFVREQMKDSRPQVRAAAIRVSETLYKQGDKSLAGDIRALGSDRDANVALQAILTANLLKLPDAKQFIAATVAKSSSKGVRLIGDEILNPPKVEQAPMQLSAEQKALLDRGAAIYQELCFACHGTDGKGMQVEGAPKGTTLAPPLAGSKTVTGYPDGVINVVLHGLAGPVSGKTYEAQMVPMANNDDYWVSAIISYVRNSFGNRGGIIEPKEVAHARATYRYRTEPWTLEELHAALPQPLKITPDWKLTASHRTNAVRNAIDGKVDTRFDTGTSQVPGMWFTIELPQAALVSGLELNSTPSPRDYPRGYEVDTSLDGATWGSPVAIGKGDEPVTLINFQPVRAKFIRIRQTGSVNGLFWSIHELQVFQPGEKKLAAKAGAKSSFE